MEKVPRLCDLKGAALSILVFLSMHGERNWSVSELCGDESTGYSDKPVKAGLLKLMELGLITEVRKNRYELKGGSVFQLPLSWDERIEAFGETPKIAGDSPRSFGVSPNRELEERVAALEAAVFRGLPVSEAGDSPIIFGDSPKVGGDAARWPVTCAGFAAAGGRPGARDEMYAGSFAEKFGITPNDPGESPMFEADGKYADDGDGSGITVPESREEIYSGNFPGKFGESPKKSGVSPKDVDAAGTGPAGSSPREEMESGEIPNNVGESPKKSGESPKGLINNINNTCEKKVSKYVGTDTYLLGGNEDERKVNNPETQLGSQAPVQASLQQVPGPVLPNNPEPEAAEMIHWKAAMEQMKTLMDRGSFTTMLKNAEVLGYVNGHYTIGVKNQMVRDWVDQRCRMTIEKVLNGMSGNAGVVQSVSFVVSEVSETQLGGQSPVPASLQQVPGPVLPNNPEPEAAEMIHWKAAMEQMKTLMDRGSFTTMLKNAEVLGYVNGHYTIGVKNQMVRDWVDQRCRMTIEKVLNGMSGNAGVVQSVSFVVSEVSETQLGGQSPVPASRQQVTGPVLLPESVDPEENVLVGICNAYLLDPTGPDYSADQLAELVGMHPDPDVLRFVLPRLSGFEAVKGWCAADRKTAKRWLLTYFKIVGTAVDHLSKNDRVSFGLIVSVCMDQGIEDLSGVETKTANQMRGKAIWLIESMAKEVVPK